MHLEQLVRAARSYRSFDESRKITMDELKEIISVARLTPAAGNKQPLKYFLCADAETNAKIQALTAWGALIRNQYQLPPEGHKPTAFIIICSDDSIALNASFADKDVGIVAQTILLKAAEMGLGGCMIGAFKPEVKEAVGLTENLRPALIVALGKPDETIILEDASGSTNYYRDENGVHHVPKRTLDELIVNA